LRPRKHEPWLTIETVSVELPQSRKRDVVNETNPAVGAVVAKGLEDTCIVAYVPFEFPTNSANLLFESAVKSIYQRGISSP